MICKRCQGNHDESRCLHQEPINIKAPMYMGYYKRSDGGRDHIWLDAMRPHDAWQWEEPHGQYYVKDIQ